jgi:hypothetical protein
VGIVGCGRGPLTLGAQILVQGDVRVKMNDVPRPLKKELNRSD